MHTWSEKALKGTVVNRTLPSLHGQSLNYAYSHFKQFGFNDRYSYYRAKWICIRLLMNYVSELHAVINIFIIHVFNN